MCSFYDQATTCFSIPFSSTFPPWSLPFQYPTIHSMRTCFHHVTWAISLPRMPAPPGPLSLRLTQPTPPHIPVKQFQRLILQKGSLEFSIVLTTPLKLPRQHSGKESACQCRRCKRLKFDPWVRTPWSRKRQRSPVSLPGKSHGQRSLAVCNPWGLKESDTTEH